MPKISLTNQLRDEYTNLYSTCEIKPERFSLVDNHVDDIITKRDRYENVGNVLGIPWYFIAVVHSMESGRKFSRHLHNGDSLKERTKHVPSGRPKEGEPPFTWEESAEDALKLRKLDKVENWDLPQLLYELEGYNGWGYRLYHQHVLSPYLWSFSNHYKSGKYVADGTWSDSAVSKQVGAAVLLRRLQERGEIDFQVKEKTKSDKKPLIAYSNRKIEMAEELQQFLNSLDGITLRVDGIPGEKTSDAVKRVFGYYLKGDPRI